MSRPRTVTGGPLAAMTDAECADLAALCGVILTSATKWRTRRPPKSQAFRIADHLHGRDPERWPDPSGLARVLVEMGPGR